jgi:copper resistance protein B
VQLDLAVQDVPELRLGSKLSTAELGLRLRYEIVPEFAPYLGVHYEPAIGRTAEFRRADGEDVDALGAVEGARFWF